MSGRESEKLWFDPFQSGSLEGAGGIGGLLARSSGYSGGNWTSHACYHADGNGNITYLVNSSQTLAASYRYDPFGNTISSSGSLAAANVYRFSSKECQSTAGCITMATDSTTRISRGG